MQCFKSWTAQVSPICPLLRVTNNLLRTAPHLPKPFPTQICKQFRRRRTLGDIYSSGKASNHCFLWFFPQRSQQHTPQHWLWTKSCDPTIHFWIPSSTRNWGHSPKSSKTPCFPENIDYNSSFFLLPGKGPSCIYTGPSSTQQL